MLQRTGGIEVAEASKMWIMESETPVWESIYQPQYPPTPIGKP